MTCLAPSTQRSSTSRETSSVTSLATPSTTGTVPWVPTVPGVDDAVSGVIPTRDASDADTQTDEVLWFDDHDRLGYYFCECTPKRADLLYQNMLRQPSLGRAGVAMIKTVVAIWLLLWISWTLLRVVT